MPSRAELVAHNRDTEAIAKEIGADLVIFQTLPDLISSVQRLNPSINAFDCSVFTGEYVTGGVDAAYLEHLESLRADNQKHKAQTDTLGASEGKGGGGIAHGVNGVQEQTEVPLGCSGPMNGADDTIGLFNYRR
jgi:amidophosphoribosyltransferase